MQEGANAKQQIAEKLRNSTNILVTVGKNPSVDALSAALGLTLLLNKMDKHGTAVFSGMVPPAIDFLEPKKTFEDTTDSLRDFIIALDKEKADRLRYKVDGDMVRIYITPYRTTITNKDLEFSQGDFNVEAIVALGVERREDLDQAIAKHGRILHDATVMTLNTDNGQNNLGSVAWQDAEASSLCEMLVALSESLQTGVLDEQISTALLTGIVAATDRFSNELTKPRVMTMAAQLMAAGANQQLIATKLEDSHVIKNTAQQPTEEKKPEPETNFDGSTNLKENASSKVRRDEKKDTKKDQSKPKSSETSGASGQKDASQGNAQTQQQDKAKKGKDPGGEMQVDHGSSDNQEKQPPQAKIDSSTAGLSPDQIESKKQSEAVNAAEGALADYQDSHQMPMAPQSPTLADLERELEKEASQTSQSQPSSEAAGSSQAPQQQQPSQPPDSSQQEPPKERKAFSDHTPSWQGHRVEPPTMGGTLNATSDQAMKDKQREDEEARNQATLYHGERPINEYKAPPTSSAPGQPQASGQLPQVSPPPMTSASDQPQVPTSPLDSNSGAGQGTQTPPPPPAMPPSAPQVTAPPAWSPTQSSSSSPGASTPSQPPVDSIDAARDAVHAAIGDSSSGSSASGMHDMPGYEATPPPTPQAAPPMPDQNPQASPGVPPPPPMPDMNNMPPMPPAAPSAPSAPPETNTQQQAGNGQQDPFGPPPLQFGNDSGSSNSQQASGGPGQFKIPGQ